MQNEDVSELHTLVWNYGEHGGHEGIGGALILHPKHLKQILLNIRYFSVSPYKLISRLLD